MIIELYFLILVCAFVFMGLSLMGNQAQDVMFAFVSFVLFTVAIFPSYKIEKTHCDFPYDNATIVCDAGEYEEKWISYLWSGFALFMLVYGIIMAFWVSGEELQNQLEQPG